MIFIMKFAKYEIHQLYQISVNFFFLIFFFLKIKLKCWFDDFHISVNSRHSLVNFYSGERGTKAIFAFIFALIAKINKYTNTHTHIIYTCIYIYIYIYIHTHLYTHESIYTTFPVY